MTPPLVPIPASGITASYITSASQLVLSAKGTIPGYFFEPIFVRDKSADGLRYSLGAYCGGLGRVPDENAVDVTDKFDNISLADGETVVVETQLGKFTIEVKRQ
ncbi:hypothetical protein CSOJ01_15450 [Colletotrichum sojae]|uniref:Uncharacterized protein n=1 Tax=Colletotrichum sojae TaxID=2175907 RepID=A0A8H6MI37_9PEZI|nr:hypothetical protein CSOJ01_15450 [Colletotrichum sojae]